MTTTIASHSPVEGALPPETSAIKVESNTNSVLTKATEDSEYDSAKRKLELSSDASQKISENTGDEDIADSEAETELLHETPKKSASPRKRARLEPPPEAEEDGTNDTLQSDGVNEDIVVDGSDQDMEVNVDMYAGEPDYDTNGENSIDEEPIKGENSEDETGEGDTGEESRKSSSNGKLNRRSSSALVAVVTGAADDDDDDGVPDQVRQEAVSMLTDIEVEFAKVRDTLHNDRIKRFEAEIEMCVDGTHPELADYFTQIAKYRDHKVQLAKFRRDYQLKRIDNETHASRDQLHQQFIKDQADARVMLLLETTEEWYKVNRERRSMDSLTPEFSFRTPENRSIQASQRATVKHEVAILSGISNYIGFPAAPEMRAANQQELQDDLEALGIEL